MSLVLILSHNNMIFSTPKFIWNIQKMEKNLKNQRFFKKIGQSGVTPIYPFAIIKKVINVTNS